VKLSSKGLKELQSHAT